MVSVELVVVADEVTEVVLALVAVELVLLVVMEAVLVALSLEVSTTDEVTVDDSVVVCAREPLEETVEDV